MANSLTQCLPGGRPLNPPRVVVVGSVAMDDIVTPTACRSNQLGGSASYACVAASFFTSVGMVGIVGSDFPAPFVQRFRRAGVDLRGLQVVPGKTFRWSGVYEKNMDIRRTLKTELNVFADFQPALPEAYIHAPFILLANISPRLQLHVLDQIRNPRFVAADTMNLWIQTEAHHLRRVLARIDLLTLNESEAREWTGYESLSRAARRLLAMGPRWILIKRGEQGSRLFSTQGLALMPAYPLESVKDPTGAGDLFAGGLVGRLAQGNRIDEAAIRRAMQAGSVVASLGVEQFGLERLWSVKRMGVDARIRDFRRMVGWR